MKTLHIGFPFLAFGKRAFEQARQSIVVDSDSLTLRWATVFIMIPI